MTTIVTRAGKGSPLTHTEVDTNFTNLNTNKLEAGAIALGSAATPSISFTGDTNTGIFSPGADQLAISTNGTGRLFVDASGNVHAPVTFRVGNGGAVGALSVQATTNGNLHIRDITTITTGTGVALDVLNDAGSAVQDFAIRGTNTIFNNSTGETLRITSTGALNFKGAGTAGSTQAVSFNGSAPVNSMVLTSGGLLGIGTSSPAFAVDISAANDTIVRSRTNGNTSAGFIGSTNNGTNNWFFGSRKDATGGSSGTDRFNLLYDTNAYLTVTTAGNVGIGTTSPTRQLDVNSTAIFDSNGNGTTTSPSIAIGSSGVGFSYIGSQQLAFLTNSNERARIDSSGRLLVGTSSGTYKLQVEASSQVGYFHHTGSSDTIGMILRHGRGLSGFTGKMVSMQRNDGTEVGSIVIGESSTAYNTSSDYRLKENVVNLDNAIDRLNLLAVCRFNFIDNPERIVDGFIAHEVQEVVPEAITGEKDAVDTDGNPIYQGIDQSKLVPLLTAALQEAIGRIETLEAEVAALKAQ